MRIALLAVNLAILAVIAGIILVNPRASTQAAPALDSSGTTAAAANPLDQVSSADIALTVARVSSLPETTAINNQAQSQAADVAIAATDNSVTAKPEVITTALKSRADIQTYIVRAGDTIPSLATRFGITSDSIRWSNNINGDKVPAGTKLLIPPVTGIVYTVKAGDTAASLAARFNSSKEQILAYNDGEIAGLHIGERIIIPNAAQQNATAAAGASGTGAGAFPWGSSPIYGYNGYDFGNCTWYVASQLPVPANWGNAATWAYYARQSGWSVGSTPSVGAIAQTSAGYFGHVAIVRAVHGNMVTISEMNFQGFDVVDTRTAPASEFQNYISH